MSSNRLLLVTVALALAPASHVLAQPSNVHPVRRWSWSENTGWMNWRDAGSPAGSQGVVFAHAFLSGFAWSENVGYVCFGDGSPANGSRYSNASAADFGVNIESDGLLTGFAWAENAGWISFGPSTTLPGVQRARLDRQAGRLRGYAWGENIGWISLDAGEHHVGVGCAADLNGDGDVSVHDLLAFLTAFRDAEPAADVASPFGTVTVQDLLGFLTAFRSGC